MARPAASAAAVTVRALSTSMVEQSISSGFAFATASMRPPWLSHTSRTSSPAGSMVMTTSAPFAASAALAAAVPPAAARACARGGIDVVARDAMARLDEIGRHGRAHVAEADETDGRHDREPRDVRSAKSGERAADHSAFASSTSLATVFMLRAVPVSAALIFNFELAIPSP